MPAASWGRRLVTIVSAPTASSCHTVKVAIPAALGGGFPSGPSSGEECRRR
jgi:hypothetical protein